MTLVLRVIMQLVKWSLLAIGGIVTIWFFGWLAFLSVITAAHPHAVDEVTDAIVVVTGGQNRINTGLDLLASGKARYLFISGVNPHTTAEHLVKLWKPGAAEPCCIVLGTEAHDTVGNAKEVSAWVRDQKIGSIRLVTSNYHLPRAEMELKHALPGHRIVANPIRPTAMDDDSHHFLRLSFFEYNKTIAAWLRLYVYPWNTLFEIDRI